MARAIQRGRSAAGAAAGGRRKKPPPPPPPKLGDPPPSSSDDDDELEFKGSQEEKNDDDEEESNFEEDEEDERKPPAKKSVAPRRRKKAATKQQNARHKKDEEDRAEAEAEYQEEAEDSFDSADDGADSPIPSDPNDSGSDFDPDEDDGEEGDNDDELNESSDGWAPEGTGRRSKVNSRGRAGDAKKRAPTRPSGERTKFRASRRRKIVESSSEEEDNYFDNDSDDDEEFGSPSRRMPRRSCAKATNAKLASATKVIELGSDQDEADAESEDYPMISSSRKKKRKRSGGGKGRSPRKKQLDSDEESYHESDSDDANEEEDEDDDDDHDDEIPSSDDDVVIEEDDEDVIRSGRSRRGGGRSKSKQLMGRKSVDDDMDIFTADTSDSDASGGGEQRRKFSPKPPLKTRPVRRRAIDEDDSDEEETSFGGDSDSSNFGSAIRKSPHSTPRTPKCPSKSDEITMEPLPRLHVCCIAPDGESRHCFALDTLYRIALMDPRRHHSVSNKIAFKQPPHFRSAMEDELVDQIASRFGRLALNIEDSNVYKKSVVGQNRTVHLDYLGDMSVDASQDFHDRFNEYLSSQMGSGDLYCCPVCYVEAHKRLVDGTEPDDDSEKETDGARVSSRQVTMELDDFQYDPMTVLGGLDGEDFGIASNFCFRKVSQVKKHLRDEHHCATKDVEGNDLYQRFQIRAADGLLQRWLNKHDKKSFHLQIRSAGAMNSYWYHGHNASFIFLRDRVEAVQRILEAPGDGDNELDQTDTQKSAEYFESFERRGRRIWAQLSAPYEKEDPSAINDFIADDDEEDEVGDRPAPFAANIFEDDKSPEQQIIEAMRTKRRRQGPAPDVSSDDYEEEESSEDDLEIVGEDQKYYSEEEDEDEWTKKKSLRESLKKRRSDAAAAKHSQLTGDSDSDTSSGSKAAETPRQKETKSGSNTNVAKTPAANASTTKGATSSLKKRRILESSDEDE